MASTESVQGPEGRYPLGDVVAVFVWCVVRGTTLLAPLDNDTIAELNGRVSDDGEDPRAVAESFLTELCPIRALTDFVRTSTVPTWARDVGVMKFNQCYLDCRRYPEGVMSRHRDDVQVASRVAAVFGAVRAEIDDLQGFGGYGALDLTDSVSRS